MKRRFPTLAVVVAAIAAVAAPASAHEKWFLDSGSYPLRFDLLLRPFPLTVVGAVLLSTLVAAVVWKRTGERDFIPGPERLGATAESRRQVYGLLPLIVGVHVAIPLVYSGLHDALFSPNLQLEGVPRYLVSTAEVAIALAFFYGGLTRLAAIALALLWFAGISLVGLEPMLENALYLGAAAFLFLAGRGPIAIDRLMFPRLEPSPALVRRAVIPLRVGLGLSFAIVAFTEKLARIPYALAFLAHYPLNISGYLGIPLSNETFVVLAGAVELTIGLWIMLGIYAREIIILAWLPINLTLTYFNATELVGHLPIYGMMALLVIWIPGNRNLDEWVSGVCGARRAP